MVFGLILLCLVTIVLLVRADRCRSNEALNLSIFDEALMALQSSALEDRGLLLLPSNCRKFSNSRVGGIYHDISPDKAETGSREEIIDYFVRNEEGVNKGAITIWFENGEVVQWALHGWGLRSPRPGTKAYPQLRVILDCLRCGTLVYSASA